MNKKITKALRSVGSQLGISYEMNKYPEFKTGAEFQKLGADFEDGMVVVPDAMYKKYRYFIVQIKHYRRLKRAYTKKGAKGVQDYILWLHGHNERMKPIFEEMKLNRELMDKMKGVDKGLLEIARGKASNFWSALITFLYSFMFAFGTKEEETVGGS